MSKLRVLIVDDHGVIRGGMRSMLQSEPDIDVVGEAARGEEALEKARQARPDVVLMDISLPGISGIEATRRLKAEFPAIRAIILTVHDDEEFFFAALRAGADGYVVKSAEPTELLSAVRSVARGNLHLPPEATRAVVECFLSSRNGSQEEGTHALTPREKEVLRLAAAGQTNREMARMLVLSMRTVEKHRQAVMHKLGLTRREELTKYAIRKGLIDVGSEN